MDKKELSIIVLAEDHCSTTRAYLEYMEKAKLKSCKIVRIKRIGRGKRATLMSRIFGKALVGEIVEYRNWKCLKQRGSGEFKRLCNLLQQGQPIQIDFWSKVNYEKYSSNVETVVVKDLADPVLQQYIQREVCKTFLYTGGGVVPDSLLKMPEVKLLHIHPGVVPQVRGSDGLLWSLATRGRPGASCFYMSAGIDMGAVIATQEYTKPVFSIAGKSINYQDFYDALQMAYDPHLRAQLLLRVLKRCIRENIEVHAIPTFEQKEDEARTYFTMHSSMKKILIDEMILNYLD